MNILSQKLWCRLIMVLVFIGLVGCEQARVDAQMEVHCKQDGGMKIYEKVVLPKEQFNYGVPIFFSTWNKAGGGYGFIHKSEQIKVKRPSYDILTWNHARVSKTTLIIIRESDQKILGTYVYYSRIGGAIMPRLGSDPAKGCPTNSDSNNFLNTIFTKKN